MKLTSLGSLSLLATVAISSSAFAQTDPNVPVPAPAVVTEAKAPEVAVTKCVDALAVAPVTQIAISKIPRTAEQISSDSKTLLDRLVSIAKNPETSSVSLQVHDELIKQYEPFRIASEKFIVSRGSAENLELVRGLALMRTSSVSLQKKITTMNRLLSPTTWQKIMTVSAYTQNGKNKKINTIADEIQVCRSNIQTCLSNSQRLIGGREKDLADIKNVLLKVEEELSILSQVTEELGKNSESLSQSVQEEISSVIATQVRNFEIIRAVMKSGQQSLDSEIRVALQLIDGTGDLIHHQIQLLAVAGAPERILTIKTSGIGILNPSAKGVRSQLRNALLTAGISDKAKLSVLKDFITAEKSINDVELLFILEHIPRAIGWGSPDSFVVMFKKMKELGLTSWALPKSDWLAVDMQVVWMALTKVDTRELSNDQLKEVPQLLNNIVSKSATWTNQVLNDNFRTSVDVFYNKLLLQVLEKGN